MTLFCQGIYNERLVHVHSTRQTAMANLDRG